MFSLKELKRTFHKRHKNWSADAALRYLPIVKIIHEEAKLNDSILEVGSGSVGITPYLKRKIVGVDVNFKGPKTNLLRRVFASAEKLPFPNKSFDCVICVDALEHVRPALRRKIVNELLRVGRKIVIIGVPCGAKSMKEDIYINNLFLKVMKKQDPFLKEHLENNLPTEKEMLNFLKNNGEIKVLKNVNIFLHRYILKTQVSKRRIFNFISGFINILLLPIFLKVNYGECYRLIFIVKKR